MTENWERVKELFTRTHELPAAEREEFLARECADDRERAAVETLLRSADAAGDFMESPPAAFAAALVDDDDPLVGTSVGPYRIVRELGHGGMGRVYFAERTGDFTLRVALKVVRRGLDSDEVVRRFRQERQVLAALDHHNIAGIIDGGTTADNRPYLVMEYVDGEPIDAYCERLQLSIEARLKLFLQVCAAVDHAHRNLVVHRDLKPRNILVTAEGTPVLLDFGIAKVLNPDLVGETLTGSALGGPMTPDYASPEQIAGAPITTSADVYALGVILFELLTGTKPYRLVVHTPEEMRRIIVEQEAPRASSVSAKALARQLSGDLDTIVERAMRKDPAERYRSVASLADDVQRHLEGRPILARPDRVTYRLAKFVRRHRAAVGAGLVIAVVLLGMLAVAVRQTLDASAQRKFAVSAANTLAADVAEAMQRMLGPTEERLNVLTKAQAVFDSVRASGVLTRKDELQAADANRALAQAYRSMGQVPRAVSRIEAAEAAADALASHPDAGADEIAVLGAILIESGDVLNAAARNAEALRKYERAVMVLEGAVQRRDAPATARQALAMALSRKADRLFVQGAIDAAKPIFIRIHDLLGGVVRERSNDPRALSLFAMSKERLADSLYYGGKVAESCNWYCTALDIRRRAAAGRPTDPHLLGNLSIAMQNCGWCAVNQQKLEEGRALYREGIAFQRRLVSTDPSTTSHVTALMGGVGELANSFVQNREHAAAIPIYEESLKIGAEHRAVWGDSAEVALKSASVAQLLADAYSAVGRFDGARRTIGDSVAGMRAARKRDPRNLDLARDEAAALLSLVKLARRRGRWNEAVAAANDAVALTREISATSKLSKDRQELAHALHDLGLALRDGGDAAGGRKALAEAREVLVALQSAGELDASSDGEREYLPAVEAALAALR